MRIVALLLCLISAVGASTAAARCEPGRVLLQVLGSGGPELDDGRASSGYLLRLDGRARLLVDAGGGSARNFERSGARLEDLRAILFTHFHVDHSVELPTYIKAMYFSPRDTDLMLYGPSGNRLMPSTGEFLQDLFGPQGAFRYLNEYLDPDQPADFHLLGTDVPLEPRTRHAYRLADGTAVAAVPVHHGPIAALAWRVELGGCAVTFSGDMSNRYQTLTGLAAGSDLLVAHNAVPQGATGIARQLHMPPSEIGRIAADAKVGRLVLSHRMRRTLGREAETLAEVRARYRGPVDFADDMDCFDPADPHSGRSAACPGHK